MDPLLTTIAVAVVTCLIGIAIGWRIGTRRYRLFINDVEQESGARSLELLETRQHLRKISGHLTGHLNGSLKKDKTIRRLRAKQKSLQHKIEQQNSRARRLEKAHYIQTAKIKLEMIEARMQSRKPAENNINGSKHNGRTNAHVDDNYLTRNKGPESAPSKEQQHSITDTPLPMSNGKKSGQLNNELQLLLKQAGIRRVRQLANLSSQDIEQLTSQADRYTAE